MNRQDIRELAVDASQQDLRDIAVNLAEMQGKLDRIEGSLTEWKPTVDLARDIFAAGKVARWIAVAVIGSSLALYSAWKPMGEMVGRLIGK